MTKAYIALKDYPKLNTLTGHQIIMSEKDSIELKMSDLVTNGIFKELTEKEALEMYKSGRK